ncbi:MAG: hypothetical protein ACK46M_16105 [Planctomyces sp.]|jgi:hypothetical protein
MVYGLLFLFAAASRISGHILLLANRPKIPSGFFQKVRGIWKVVFFQRFGALANVWSLHLKNVAAAADESVSGAGAA